MRILTVNKNNLNFKNIFTANRYLKRCRLDLLCFLLRRTSFTVTETEPLVSRFESRKKKPIGPRLDFTAEDAVHHQLEALKYNDQPLQDYGIEVMYRFAGFDPFERSTYFGPFFDLGQFERFRRIFHHSSYRVLLGHKERKIMSSLFVEENKYKQRIWVRGSRPEEEEIFQFTMVQRVGGCWDGYWLTESLLNDRDTFSGGLAY
ncbi:unnamed protein product [Trifolium pratense]|uniref:Uncharacterized protein n=1 Tax=Trifolium pratense TaxID=57577 RepID=A0ACB0JIM4_TRIPR|nr:unnamed protein product [Trifolium pratense]